VSIWRNFSGVWRPIAHGGARKNVLCSPWGSEGAPESVVVYEWQDDGIRTISAQLHQHKLGLWGDLAGFAAPLWSHPPELDA
jgi:hypothetical protein